VIQLVFVHIPSRIVAISFFYCLLYVDARAKMLHDFNLLFPNITITTDVLLYGNDLISKIDSIKVARLVEKYILESGRFRS